MSSREARYLLNRAFRSLAPSMQPRVREFKSILIGT